MSTETWIDPNDKTKRYEIGTIGWEGPKKLSQLPDSIVLSFLLTI